MERNHTWTGERGGHARSPNRDITRSGNKARTAAIEAPYAPRMVLMEPYVIHVYYRLVLQVLA